MKSPSNSVGIMESEGIRNGSNKNERITKTSTMTGKNERAYSTAMGSRTRSAGVPADAAASFLRSAKKSRSSAQMTPDSAPTTTSIKLKSTASYRNNRHSMASANATSA